MNPLPLVALGVAATGAMLLLARRPRPVPALDPERFTLEATVDQWTDIEAARLALKNSHSAEVQFYAQLIVDNNKALNNQLKTLANGRGMQVPSKTDLQSIVNEKIPDLQSGEGFDAAYASVQPDTQQKRVALYQKATELDDIDLANYARQGLEKMQEHLKMSRALVTHLQLDETKSTAGHYPPPQNSSMAQVTGTDTHLSKGVPQQVRSEAGNPGH